MSTEYIGCNAFCTITVELAAWLLLVRCVQSTGGQLLCTYGVITPYHIHCRLSLPPLLLSWPLRCSFETAVT
jgi:hypothetical protein